VHLEARLVEGVGQDDEDLGGRGGWGGVVGLGVGVGVVWGGCGFGFGVVWGLGFGVGGSLGFWGSRGEEG